MSTTKQKTIKLSSIKPNPDNPRLIKDDKFFKLLESIKTFGEKMMPLRPIVIDENNIILGGNMRFKALKELGYKEVPAEWIKAAKDLTEEQKKEFIVKDNVGFGSWDFDVLANDWDSDLLEGWGLDMPDWEMEDFGGLEEEFEEGEKEVHNLLSDRFIVPPFSILDTRKGYWTERKRYWKELIGDNGESREGTLADQDGMMGGINNGVSILDPVLAELSNLWFGINNCKTFDCFAGDSVFGVVSDAVGNSFTGIELRQEQADLNNQRLRGSKSKYFCDDGQNVLKHIPENSQDLLFSCPPYFNLEVYSDLKNDASNQKEYKDFLNILDNAFSGSIKCLKDNRFAVIVISNIRDKKGFYYNLVDDIKNIFIKNNMPLYNDMILLESVGTLPQRVANSMKNRKVGKCHQNVLVFYKGDPKKIQENFPKIEVNIEDLEFMNEEEEAKKKIEVSYKWASKILGCEGKFIAAKNGCGGACCKTISYYPAKANGGICKHLGELGCNFTNSDRPIKCLLYPFVINKKNKIVLHGRAILGTCKPCYKKGDKMIIEQLKNNFIEIFGVKQYERVLNDVKNKRDSYFLLPEGFNIQMNKESELEEKNINPIPRKGRGSYKEIKI